MLVLCPRGSCLEEILDHYTVGLAADVTSATAIEAALRQLTSHAISFQRAYDTCGIPEAYAGLTLPPERVGPWANDRANDFTQQPQRPQTIPAPLSRQRAATL